MAVGSLFLLYILRRNGLKMLSGIIVHIIGDNGFLAIYTPLRTKEMIICSICNMTLINEFFVITTPKDDN